MKADAKTEAAVMARLHRFAEAYTKRDLDGFLGLFAPDSDVVVFGTGADEKRIGLTEVAALLERDWSQTDTQSLEFGWISVSAAGSVAWVAADMTAHVILGGQEMSYPGRLTAVLEQRGDRWLFAQTHFSLPAYAQAVGEAWPTSIDAVVASVQAERPDLSPHTAPDGTVTILFSDIEGSAAITERLGDLRWVEVLRAHKVIIREQVAAHDGFEVKEVGDGFMLAFQSARRALQCAIAVQRAFAQHNESAEEPIRVRMGLHAGEVIKEADPDGQADFFGRHVILASRVANEAQGGQILVSSLLKELTESAGDIQFGEGREVELKGLAGSHRVFAVVWEAA
jgi:class 3 adenylate cyclase/ketosteroid isomerase-like protein